MGALAARTCDRRETGEGEGVEEAEHVTTILVITALASTGASLGTYRCEAGCEIGEVSGHNPDELLHLLLRELLLLQLWGCKGEAVLILGVDIPAAAVLHADAFRHSEGRD
jgi:hypothetical protein